MQQTINQTRSGNYNNNNEIFRTISKWIYVSILIGVLAYIFGLSTLLPERELNQLKESNASEAGIILLILSMPLLIFSVIGWIGFKISQHKRWAIILYSIIIIFNMLSFISNFSNLFEGGIVAAFLQLIYLSIGIIIVGIIIKNKLYHKQKATDSSTQQ